MPNNILFHINFWMHNNLKVTNKILLLTSIKLEGMPTFMDITVGITIIGSTELEELYLKRQKQNSTPNCSFSTSITPIRMFLNKWWNSRNSSRIIYHTSWMVSGMGIYSTLILHLQLQNLVFKALYFGGWRIVLKTEATVRLVFSKTIITYECI